MKLIKYGLCAALLLNSMLTQTMSKSDLKSKTKTTEKAKEEKSIKRKALEIIGALAGVGTVLGIGYKLRTWVLSVRENVEKEALEFENMIANGKDIDAEIIRLYTITKENPELLLNDQAYLTMLDGTLKDTTLPQDQKTRLSEILNQLCQGFTGAYDAFIDYSKQEFEVVTVNNETKESVTSKLRIADLPNFDQIKELVDNAEARNAIIAEFNILKLRLPGLPEQA